MPVRRVLSQLFAFRKTFILILAPFLLAPLPLLVPTREAKCAYGLLLMAVYWCTETIPIAVTALMPVIIFPFLGVASSKQLCLMYLKDTNFLFVGGLMVAVAVEKWNLHRRLALRTLLLVGSEPRWLIFGFMTTTAFLSMWISNTATAAMIIPIAHAILSEMGKQTADPLLRTAPSDSNTKATPEQFSDENKLQIEEANPPEGTNNSKYMDRMDQRTADQYRNTCKAMTLCIAYSANIGGIATLTGTATNVVFKGILDTLYGDAGVNFTSWFVFGFPTAIISLLLAWIWLQIFYLGGIRGILNCFRRCRTPANIDVQNVIRKEYDKLGPITFAQVSVACLFALLAILWFTRDPGFFPGWASYFIKGYITDATTGMLIAFTMFVFPSQRPRFFCCRAKGDKEKSKPVPALLDWESVQTNFPWNVIILLGGGFALAEACKVSGLSNWMGQQFIVFKDVPRPLLQIILCTISAGFTEFTSNTSSCSVFVPIVAQLAVALHVNPLYFMMPVAISASFSFMLPVATPPNAIVFSYGHVSIMDMVKAGSVMNFICLLVVTFGINTYGSAYFNLDQFPSWAVPANVTASSTPSPFSYLHHGVDTTITI